MLNRWTVRATRAALAATCLIPFATVGAYAQSADSRSTAEIEKENAALRAKIRRLEVEKENIGLRAKVDQLQGRRSVQPTAVQGTEVATPPLVTRIETSSPDRSLVMADLPMKAAPMFVPAYSWTGFYFGGNIGYSVGNDRAQATQTNITSTLASGDYAVAPTGAIGGVQLGYNYQVSPSWLFGFEADFQGSDQKAKGCLVLCLNIFTPTDTQIIQFTTTHKLDYFGTLRGRAGWIDGGNLFYVTGGGAYGRFNQTYEFTSLDTSSATANVASASTIENKFGWVVGAGLESSLGGNWTGKIEYLYMDLGNTTTSLPTTPVAGSIPSSMVGSTSIRDNIVRAGLNYRIGAPAAPASAYDAMAAVPPAIYSWTGFYVGANIGYGFGAHHTQYDEIANIPGFTIPITGAPGTSVNPKGILGGVQLGYNWQVGQRGLVGFEADLQGSNQKDTACAFIVCAFETSTVPGDTGTNFHTVTHQIDFFSTVRGRVGAVYNNTLFYATGGAAFAEVKQTVDINVTSSTPLFASSPTTKDMIGYVVGGGIEAKLSAGWSVKAEYLYMNLGSINTTFDTGTPPIFANNIVNATVRDHIVRIGANYHFTAATY